MYFIKVFLWFSAERLNVSSLKIKKSQKIPKNEKKSPLNLRIQYVKWFLSLDSFINMCGKIRSIAHTKSQVWCFQKTILPQKSHILTC